MTRRARLALLFFGIATGVCLAAIPMQFGVVLTLGIWAGASVLAIALAIVVDEWQWRRGTWS